MRTVVQSQRRKREQVVLSHRMQHELTTSSTSMDLCRTPPEQEILSTSASSHEPPSFSNHNLSSMLGTYASLSFFVLTSKHQHLLHIQLTSLELLCEHVVSVGVVKHNVLFCQITYTAMSHLPCL